MHNPKKDQPKKYLTWKDMLYYINELGKKIPKDKCTIGIPRNGTIITGLLSHNRPDLYMCEKRLLDPWSEAENIHFLDPWSEVENIHQDIDESDTYIIDDIHDSGNTLKPFMNFGFPVATLFWRKKEKNQPDIWVETIEDDTWIVFPWEEIWE